MSDIEKLKMILRENDVPFFNDEELERFLAMNKDFDDTVYQCLLIKSQDTSLRISGMSTNDTSKYFIRLARVYKRNNSRVLDYE